MGDAKGARVTLAHHKAVVKSWRERLPRRVDHGHAHISRGVPDHDRIDTAWQWHLNALDLSRENTSTVSESVAETDEVLSDPTHADAEALHVRSVGEIKHAYRARRRREEVECERKAIQRQNEKRPVRQADTKMEAQGKLPPSTSTQAFDRGLEPEESDLPPDRTASDNDCMPLDAQLLMTSAEYRADVLRGVRHQLSAGRAVVIVVHILATTPLADVKLVVQQLCSDSLLFCVRDQNVLPLVNHEHGTVTLELLARHPEAT
jgi:hypothetical protein